MSNAEKWWSINRQRCNYGRLVARYGKHREYRMLHSWLIDNHRNLRNRPTLEKNIQS